MALQAASRLYARAVKSLEAEGKAGMAADIYRQVSSHRQERLAQQRAAYDC